METALILFICVAAGVNAQLLSPISSMGMGSGWGGPMWHSGVRYPGMMQTSQLSSMTYPTWRSHPIFRMSSSPDKNFGTNVPSDVTNVPKVPSTQEVLTHMALATQNPKPYLDTMADLFYEPQKARTVFTPVASVAPLSSVSSVAPVATVASMTPKAYIEALSDYLYEPQKARSVLAPMTSTASVAPMAPVYVQGMNGMRAGVNADDCVQEGGRWERGMDWLY